MSPESLAAAADVIAGLPRTDAEADVVHREWMVVLGEVPAGQPLGPYGNATILAHGCIKRLGQLDGVYGAVVLLAAIADAIDEAAAS